MDRQTDTQTACYSNNALCVASRGKNRRVASPVRLLNRECISERKEMEILLNTVCVSWLLLCECGTLTDFWSCTVYQLLTRMLCRVSNNGILIQRLLFLYVIMRHSWQAISPITIDVTVPWSVRLCECHICVLCPNVRRHRFTSIWLTSVNPFLSKFLHQSYSPLFVWASETIDGKLRLNG